MPPRAHLHIRCDQELADVLAGYADFFSRSMSRECELAVQYWALALFARLASTEEFRTACQDCGEELEEQRRQAERDLEELLQQATARVGAADLPRPPGVVPRQPEG